MKKAVFLANFAIMTFNVFGMNNFYEDYGSNEGVKRMSIEQRPQCSIKRPKLSDVRYEVIEYSLVDSDYTLSEDEEDFSDNSQQTQKENKANDFAKNKSIVLNYKQRRDIINDIIDQVDKDDICKKHNIPPHRISAFNSIINQWGILSEEIQKRIIKITEKGDLNYKKLGQVKTFQGTILDLDALVAYMITKKKSVWQAYEIEDKPFQRYSAYARVWEVLAKEKILLSLHNNGSEDMSKIIDAIAQQESKNDVCKKFNINQHLYDSYKTFIKLWRGLSENKRKAIVKIVQKGSPRESDLGIIESQSGIELDANIIVDLILIKTSKLQFLKDRNVEDRYTKYTTCANVWEILAKKGWEPPKEDSAYIKTRDTILTIMNSNYRNVEGRKVSVTKTMRENYISPINQWKSLSKDKQKQVIEAVQNDENNSDLEIIKTSAGTELDIVVIVKMIKAKKGKKTAVLKSIEKRLHRTYQRYAKVWEVLAKEGVIL
ncbi:MAG: hypothetical protein J6T29_00660 [Alphaproteobacteria bacterium]|nr:hypothetical protein [Alphaproteobacteria bacterium]